jgi:hypothetical protein
MGGMFGLQTQHTLEGDRALCRCVLQTQTVMAETQLKQQTRKTLDCEVG